MSMQLENEAEDPSFPSMNLQQHSSYGNKGTGMTNNMMSPPVQPMMTSMYYVPDYTTQEYNMQSVSNMQGSSMQTGFMQSQNYDQVTQVSQ